jgi:drug/metabolite transporter (DMT)-like permease
MRAIALVLLLCTIWGVQQVVMKGVAADVAPTMQLAIRFAGASIFLGCWWHSVKAVALSRTAPCGVVSAWV